MATTDPATRGNRHGFLARGGAIIGDIFTRPFHIAMTDARTLSPQARNRERRQAILRLFLFIVGIFILTLALPLSIAQHLPLATTVILSVVGLLSFLSILLGARGWTTSAAAIFVFGIMVGIAIFVIHSPTGLDLTGLTAFIALPLLIVFAGLVFPPVLVLATTIVSVGVTVVVFLWSITQSTPSTLFLSRDQAITIMVRFIGIQLITALLTYIASRSADSGVREATEAYLRERELTELKDRFIEDTNHELRTPIMSWYGSTELLTHIGADVPAERQERALQRALRAGAQVLKMLDSIMDVTIVESHAVQLQLQPLPLARVMTSILETFDPLAVGETGLRPEMLGERAIELAIAADLTVIADEARFRQVINNLVSNALKYSPAGSPLEITAAFAGQRAPTQNGAALPPLVEIRVRDHGAGIPPAEAHKLFQRFVRLERDIGGKVRGTGVGLYLSRVFIEAMGGTIWVESSGVPGEGSTLCFTLPSATTPSADPSLHS